MAEDSDLEKTEPASSRRLEQAREEGNVPQSRELAGFMVMAAGVAALWMLGGWFAQRLTFLLRQGLTFHRDAAFDSNVMLGSSLHLAIEAMITLAPLFLFAIAGAIATPFLIGGWVFSPKAFQFDVGRINPLKGLGRMFSKQSLAELLKAILKSALIGGVIYWIVRREQDNLFATIGQSVEVGINSVMEMLLVALIALIAGVAVIALMDVPFQLWQYYDRLKMTQEELRQEHKEMEGDPHLKARIRSAQREIARGRMMSEVPNADVVVTNPTHYAVALKYDAKSMGAPVVLAKGMNLVAGRIRELATENRIPILEAPPLARALHRHAEIGDQIPAQLYASVAEVMAYVYQLNEFASSRHALVPPQPPAHIAVPDGLDPGSPDEASA